MTTTEHGVEILSEAVCWERLRKAAVGRLGVVREGKPVIYPVNYLTDGKSIVFRTRHGSKISTAQALDRVAFEIDGFEPARGDAWSVLIKGFGRHVDSAAELEEMSDLPLFAWVAADRSSWVRIVPVEVTGRRFELIEGTITDDSVGWPARVGNANQSSAV